jgi:hypothetical protein
LLHHRGNVSLAGFFYKNRTVSRRPQTKLGRHLRSFSGRIEIHRGEPVGYDKKANFRGAISAIVESKPPKQIADAIEATFGRQGPEWVRPWLRRLVRELIAAGPGNRVNLACDALPGWRPSGRGVANGPTHDLRAYSEPKFQEYRLSVFCW